MGDQILTLPAIRYLADVCGASTIEIRLAAHETRSRLFGCLLNRPGVNIADFDDLQRSMHSAVYNWILDFDFRDPSGSESLPMWIQAQRGYFRFSSCTSRANEIIFSSGELYWRDCFAMAAHLAKQICLPCPDLNEEAFRRSGIEPPDDAMRIRLRDLFSNIDPGKPVIAITPGGYNPAHKVWPAPNFAAVICALAERNFNVVVLGSKQELELSRRIYSIISGRPKAWQDTAPGAVTFLAGRTAPHDLPYLLQQVCLHIANDNGVAQIGGALNLPQVVLYRGTGSSHHTLGARDVPLFSGDRNSMNSISVMQVLTAITSCYP